MYCSKVDCENTQCEVARTPFLPNSVLHEPRQHVVGTLLRWQLISLLDDWNKELFRLPLRILYMSKALANETTRVNQLVVKGRRSIPYG